MRSWIAFALVVVCSVAVACDSRGAKNEPAVTGSAATQKLPVAAKLPPPSKPLPPLASAPGGATGKPAWGASFGGLGSDAPRDIAVDKDGDIVVVGSYDGDGGFGSAGPRKSQGGTDAFVMMLDPTGKVKWVQTFGGPRDDSANGIAISGNTIVVVGNFLDDITVGTFHHKASGSDDIFAVAFDLKGEPQWLFTSGGIASDGANTVAATPDGGWVIGGSFMATATIGQTDLESKGREDAVLFKLDKDVSVAWVKQFGGKYDDTIMHVVVDAQGSIIVQGRFTDVADWGGAPLKAGGNSDFDVVLAKYDANGDHQWSHRYGDAFNDVAGGVAVDPSGHITMTGSFDVSISFGEGDRHQSAGESDIFISRFTPEGKLEWARTYGAQREDIGWSIAADAVGNTVTTGWFQGSVDFGAGPMTSKGNRDVFAVKLDKAGALVWARTWGDHDNDRGRAVAVDAAGNAYVTGTYEFGIDLVTPTLQSVRAEGDRIPKPDFFVIRLDR
jgi:hypothetical protein